MASACYPWMECCLGTAGEEGLTDEEIGARPIDLDGSSRQNSLRPVSYPKEFTVRLIDDVNEFKQKAHTVYLSFYERTQYSYKAERRDPAVFSHWADSVYRFPNNLIL